MSKQIAFTVLTLLTITFAVIGHRSEPHFLSDVWSQLFWLTVGTLATTFLLEAVLHHAARRRQRSMDAFAFRSFVTNIISALEEITELPQSRDTLFEAALSGDKQFEAAAAKAASLIENSVKFEPNTYLKSYLYIANGLRDFSRQYIRLFSASRQDMLTHYQELNDLANFWVYIDEFSDASRKYAASLTAENPEKLSRDTAFRAKASSARDMVASTGKELAKLVAKVATGKSFYD